MGFYTDMVPCECGQEMSDKQAIQDENGFSIICPSCGKEMKKDHPFYDGWKQGGKRYVSLIEEWNTENSPVN